jgi:hypothetical protein
MKKFIYLRCKSNLDLKNFVKTKDQNSVKFTYFKNTFPRIGDAKTKEGVFVGPEIRELIQNVKFEDPRSEVEKTARKSLKNITTSFPGDHKAENYRDIVADLVQSKKLKGLICLKMCIS